MGGHPEGLCPQRALGFLLTVPDVWRRRLGGFPHWGEGLPRRGEQSPLRRRDASAERLLRHQLGHIRAERHRADVRPLPGDPHLQVRGRPGRGSRGPGPTTSEAAQTAARAPEHLRIRGAHRPARRWEAASLSAPSDLPRGQLSDPGSRCKLDFSF